MRCSLRSVHALGWSFLGCLATSGAQAATGIEWLDHNTNLTCYGDVRLRYEVDFDSHTPTGDGRPDRSRGRLRARVGVGYQFDPAWSVGAWLRTGNSHSQQSPHLTFAADEGDRDDLDFVADRYFVQYQRRGITARGGRNLTPFWYQDVLFWDEDVTPTGLAGSYHTKLGKGASTAAAGAFYLPNGGYDLNGQMLAGQLSYGLPMGKSQWAFAPGLHCLHGEDGQTGSSDFEGHEIRVGYAVSKNLNVLASGRQLVTGSHRKGADLCPRAGKSCICTILPFTPPRGYPTAAGPRASRGRPCTHEADTRGLVQTRSPGTPPVTPAPAARAGTGLQDRGMRPQCSRVPNRARTPARELGRGKGMGGNGIQGFQPTQSPMVTSLQSPRRWARRCTRDWLAASK